MAKKRLQKWLAFCLAVSMLMGTTALAVDGTEYIENEDGTTTQQTIATEVKPDPESGKPTVVVTIEEKINEEIDQQINPEKDDNVTDDGVTVDLDAKRTEEYESLGTDEDGNPVKGDLEHYVDEGTEIREWTEEDDGSESGQSPVTVPLVPGKVDGTEATASETVTSGDTDKSDGEWHYTETTTTDRTVTATTSEVEITVDTLQTGEMVGLEPVPDENKEGLNRQAPNESSIPLPNGAPEGFDYAYVKKGEGTEQYISRVYVVYEKDENGEVVFADGEPVIAEIYKVKNGVLQLITKDSDGDGVEEPVKSFDEPLPVATGIRPEQFILMDEEGNYVYTYCMELGVAINSGHWYSVSNLEDSDYYATEDAENHIRAIALNGYWGTESGTGSLSAIKEKMKTDLEDRQIVVGKDENGNDITESLHELIDDLTEGEALAMTQAAIWSYSNGSQEVKDGKDGFTVGDLGYGATMQGNNALKADDPVSEARMRLVHEWLTGLEADEVPVTTVINEENFVDEFSLTIGDKVGEKVSTDDNGEEIVNGIYDSALNFKLAFTPSAENDDLLVHVSYLDLDGVERTVTKRLAGTAAADEEFGMIQPDNDGNYTIEGLKLSENEDFTFDLKLEGTQHLAHGVYIYTTDAIASKEAAPMDSNGDGSLDKEVFKPSHGQQLIGVAEGEREVDISAAVTIRFDVDEDNHIRAERHWRDVGPDREPGDDDDDIVPPTGDDDDDDDTTIGDDDVPKDEFPGDDDNDTDTDMIPEEDTPKAEIPAEDIPEEDVPLAEVPKTGDVSTLWFALSALSGAGLVGLNLTGKKREDEE